jgi:hypothetical protein
MMKKVMRMVCIVILITALVFTLIVLIGNNRKKRLINELEQYSALKIDDSIKASIGATDGQTVIRIHNIPIVYAFDAYDSIEEILKSDDILATYYAVTDGSEIISVYNDVDGEFHLMDNSMILNDSKTRDVLMNRDVLDMLPQNASVLDVYYLCGESNRQGSALYYKTNIGDFVYYEYHLTGGTKTFFSANEFFDLMKSYCATLSPDTPPGNADTK